MSRDLEEEHAVAPRVDELVCGRPAQWKPTENEGLGIVRYLLGAAVSLLAHELDRCELLQPARGDVYSSERADLNETGRKSAPQACRRVVNGWTICAILKLPFQAAI